MAQDTQNPKPSQATKSFLNTIIVFNGFLVSLALTNLIAEFFKSSNGAGNGNIFPTSSISWLVFFVGSTMLLRFYFGNIAHIESDKDFDGVEISFDSVIIIIEAMLLSYATFFFANPGVFFPLLIIVLIIDMLWFGIRTFYNWIVKKKSDINKLIDASQILSLVTVVVYWIMVTDGSNGFFNSFLNPVTVKLTPLLWIFLLNTVFDVLINMPRYMGFRWRLDRDK